MFPDVPVTTILWANELCNSCNWNAVQGDDLKHNCPTIELNFLRISKLYNTDEEIAEALIKSWLGIYLVFSCRKDWINHNIRQFLTAEEEEDTCNGIFNYVLDHLSEFTELKQKAKDAILNGGKVCSEDISGYVDRILKLLKDL